MAITFDPRKDALNRRKHGISLAEAAAFEWETAVIWVDQRFHYTELRECALGLIGNTLYLMVFVQHGNNERIISLRKANKAEVRRYAAYRT
ncbi:MAG TPA: BrnT family toxin [Duganella sp.]|uniref:BrnT family toxin n=1 Tax=Duganella sp. TaxID=1904440 RepID=UPI002ED53897